jgi:hypothetical protein
MPARSAVKKAAKKTSAKVHKGKALGSVKPLKDLPSESISFPFTKPVISYNP